MGTLTALKRSKGSSVRAALSPPTSPPTSSLAPAAAPPNSKALLSPHGRTRTMPQQIWKAPERIGFLERWWIYYEGIFACSMLETLTLAASFSLLSLAPDTVGEGPPSCVPLLFTPGWIERKARGPQTDSTPPPLPASRNSYPPDSMLFLLACIFYVALSYLPAHLRVLASHGRYYAFGTGDWAPA
ncbi:hypothetical protein JCM1841_000505 [Sporobolomyces salmonicolor]